MPLKPTELIKAQTGAVSVVAQFPVLQKDLPATVFASNLAGSESAAILFSIDGGANFEPLAQDGSDLTLVATANSLAITSPMLLGVTQPAPAAASGVFILPPPSSP